MKLSQVISNYRAEHELSQRQMGAKCGLSTGYISLVEKEYNPQNGRKVIPTLPVLKKLADGMGMTLDTLLSLCDDMQVSLSKDIELKSDGSLDEINTEILSIISSLSPEKKREALWYLRNLQAREDSF